MQQQPRPVLRFSFPPFLSHYRHILFLSFPTLRLFSLSSSLLPVSVCLCFCFFLFHPSHPPPPLSVYLSIFHSPSPPPSFYLSCPPCFLSSFLSVTYFPNSLHRSQKYIPRKGYTTGGGSCRKCQLV